MAEHVFFGICRDVVHSLGIVEEFAPVVQTKGA